MNDKREIKIDVDYRYGSTLTSNPEQEMYCRAIEQAIENLTSRDPEKKKEAMEFIFKGDCFQFTLDLASRFDFDFDVEACRSALRKRFLQKRKRNGKNKNDDGRRNKANASRNTNKRTRNSKAPKEPLGLGNIFTGANY